MSQEFRIETPRLIIRPWKDSDIPEFAKMNQDPEVMEFFPSFLTPEETAGRVDFYRRHMSEHGFCFWAVELKETHEFMGFVGLAVCGPELPFSPAVEIGWRIAKKHWNQGYATEAARFVLHEAFERFNLKEVVSFTAIPNKKSMRIMEKIGMSHDPKDDFDHPKLAKDHWLCRHVLYRAKLENYLRFEFLEPKHFPHLLKFFNEPHVQAFFSLRTWTMEDIQNKYSERVLENNKSSIRSWMIYLDQTPIGFIQDYPVKAHPWPDQDFMTDFIDRACGLDFLMGEKTFLGKKIGTLVFKRFCEDHLKNYEFLVVDPDIRNQTGINFFSALGFEKNKIIRSRDALGRDQKYQLMVKQS